MRRLAFLLIACAAAVVTVGSDAGDACPTGPACTAARVAMAPTAASQPFIGIAYPGGDTGGAAILGRLDPLSLRPVSQTVELGEYHDAWSLSPDGSQLALGISSGVSLVSPPRTLHKRVGVIVVDLRTMTIVQEVETGVYAGAVGWLRPRRLVAAGNGLVVIDPRTGTILARWGLPGPLAWARTSDRLVMLYKGSYRQSASSPGKGSFSLRLAVVDERTLRRTTVSLGPLTLGRTRGGFYEDSAGLAVDPVGERAYVTAAGSPLAEVDLTTMRVSYHRLAFLEARAGELQGRPAPQEKLLNRARDVIWLGNGRLLVSGRDIVAGPGGEVYFPAGATLVDTARWRARTLDRSASEAAFAAGVVLASGPRWNPGAEVGLRGYTIAGRRVFHLLKGLQVFDVPVVGDWAYARTRSAVRVVEVGRRTVVAKIAPPSDLVDVIHR